jgi:hypothetical protein
METESDGHLPFPDFDIYRRPDCSLRHKVYRKPTHTNLYLNAKSHHHPSNKQAVLSTLIHRARALCDDDSLQAELVFLKDVFKENGYNDRQIHRALNRRPHQRHIRLEHPDKSAVAEHSIDQGYRIQYHNYSILATETRYMDRIVREAIEIELHPYNINRGGGFCLKKSWKPIIGSLKLSGHDPRTLGDAVPHS